jgi:hypothetical protein
MLIPTPFVVSHVVPLGGGGIVAVAYCQVFAPIVVTVDMYELVPPLFLKGTLKTEPDGKLERYQKERVTG